MKNNLDFLKYFCIDKNGALDFSFQTFRVNLQVCDWQSSWREQVVFFQMSFFSEDKFSSRYKLR